MLHVSYPNLFKLMNAKAGEKKRQLSFAELCALEGAGIPFPSSDLDDYHAEEREFQAIYRRRIERRRKMFLAHLNALWKYRETIRQDDRYRKVPIDFLYRILSSNPVSLSFGALLELWKSPMFQSKCDCGETAFIVNFCGSPLSGSYRASVLCPHCGKDFAVGQYGDTHKLLQSASFLRLAREVQDAKKENNEIPDENTVKFETLVGDMRRAAFFEDNRTNRPKNGKTE